MPELVADRVSRGVAVLGGANVVSQAVSVVAAPLLARLYAPEAFGVMAVFASVVGLAAGLSFLSYQEAVVVPRSDRHGRDLLALCLGLLATGVLVAAGGTLTFSESLGRLLQTPGDGVLPWLLPSGLLVVGGVEVLDRWSVRTRQYDRIARSRLVLALGQEASRIALALLVGGALGLVAGYLLGYAGAVVVLGLGLRRGREGGSGGGRPKPSWRRMRRAALRYRRFPLLAAPAAFLNLGGFYLPPVLFAALFGPQVAGWYSVAAKLVSMPMNTLGKAASHVFMGELGVEARREPGALRPLFLRFAGPLAVVSLLPALVLLAVGPWLFGFVLGEPWIEAGRYARLLGFVGAAQLVSSPLTQPSLLERQELSLALGAVRMALVLAGIVLPWGLGQGPMGSVAGYCVAMILFYGVGLGTMLRAIEGHAGGRQGSG